MILSFKKCVPAIGVALLLATQAGAQQKASLPEGTPVQEVIMVEDTVITPMTADINAQSSSSKTKKPKARLSAKKRRAIAAKALAAAKEEAAEKENAAKALAAANPTGATAEAVEVSAPEVPVVASVAAPVQEITPLPAQDLMPASESGFAVQREALENVPVAEKLPLAKKVAFAPKSQRDPTLSPDDILLLDYRERQRLVQVEVEKQKKLDEERRKRLEAERLRQMELNRIKDPSREVRGRIRVEGIIGQEVFVGSRIYTVGNSLFGARIVEVRPDEVVFSYKRQRFVKKVELGKN